MFRPVRQTAIGFNFIDVTREGDIYRLALPTGLEFEAAGLVEEIGPAVATLRVGDRVAYMRPPETPGDAE